MVLVDLGQNTLSDGDNLQVLPGESIKNKIIIPENAEVSISGVSEFQEDIELTCSTSVLRLSIQDKLKANIRLNGGTLILDNDLRIANGFNILGDGVVDVNSMSLQFPKGSFADGKVTYLNANDITLDGNTLVSTAQNFSGVGLDSDVNGHGFFWDFDTGGYVDVDADHTLYLVDLHIKDFGNYSSYGYFDIDATSTIVMQNCTIELTGNYVHDKGTIIFSGDRNKLIHQDYTFTTSAGAYFEVDGVCLSYDSLDAPNKNPFVFTDADQQKKLTNGGAIRSVYTPPSLSISSTTPVFTENYMLSTNTTMNFTNATPASAKAVTLDCNGHLIFFPLQGSNLFNLDPHVDLTIKNTVLHGFNKDVVSYGDSNASLLFGDETHLRLFEDVTLTSSDKAWTFVGDSEICGPGVSLVLDGSQRLTIDSSSTLTLKNLRVVVKNVDSIKSLDSGSKLVFENCSLVLEDAGFTWADGDIDVEGWLKIFGGDTSTVDTDVTFTFSSGGSFTVKSGSSMTIDRGIIFKYQADPSGDGGSLHAQKRHFKLEDPTSMLELNGCTIHSTVTAMALDHGRVIIDDIVAFNVDGTSAANTEMELGSSLIIIIRPSAVFDIKGVMTYNLTTFP